MKIPFVYLHPLIILFQIGYFVYDLVNLVVNNWEKSFCLVIHHVIVSCIYSLFERIYPAFFVFKYYVNYKILKYKECRIYIYMFYGSELVVIILRHDPWLHNTLSQSCMQSAACN